MDVVDSIMQKNVAFISKNETVYDAAKLMKKRDTGYLVVTGEYGKFLPLKELGIITETDLLKRVVAEDLTPHDVPVSKVMTKGLITVETGTPIDEVNMIMGKNNIRRIAILDGGKVVGIVTSKEISDSYRIISARRLVHRKYDERFEPEI
ncbi:MAG: CBS domain-containing protein [Methanobacteriota archaeon]